MAYSLEDVVKVEAIIGSSDPSKGIQIDTSKFNHLSIDCNVFSICPIYTLIYNFEPKDNKPKVFDELYLNVYLNRKGDEKACNLLTTSVTILSSNISTVPTEYGMVEQHQFLCIGSSLYTLTNKMNIAFSNSEGTKVIEGIMKLKDNILNPLTIDPEFESFDTMNWIFSQKTSIDILKKTLRHMVTNKGVDDIPLLYSNLNRDTLLTSLKIQCSKESKCIFTNTLDYNTKDEKNSRKYIKFFDKALSMYKGGNQLLTNGLGQMMYQYNPWADADFGTGLIGAINRAKQFVEDTIDEELRPLAEGFKHPDKNDGNFVYRAYESYHYSLGSIMPGNPIKPVNANSNLTNLDYVGIHTPELHDSYNVRPKIYENIVRNFFSNGIDVFCYINGQNERFQDFSQFPTLGECVDLSLNLDNNIENERNGKYFIGSYLMQFDGLKDEAKIQYTLYKDTLHLERPRNEGEDVNNNTPLR